MDEQESFDMGGRVSATPKFEMSNLPQSKKCLIGLFVVVLSILIASAFIFILIESDVMTVNFPRALPQASNAEMLQKSKEAAERDEVIKSRLVSMEEHLQLIKTNISILNSSGQNSSPRDFLTEKNLFQGEVMELNHRLNNFHPTSHEVELLLKDVQAQVLHLQLRINEMTDHKIKTLEDGQKNLERELMSTKEKLIQEKQDHLKKHEEVLAYQSLLRSPANVPMGNLVVLFSTFMYSLAPVLL